MRLISRDDGMWEMQEMGELEFIMLSKLAAAADPTGSDSAARRLYPTPLERPPMDDAEDDFVADWESLVRPDLEDQFRSSTEVVVADLAEIKGRKRRGEMQYWLEIPKKHADHWCSVLNRARLVLHERYHLPDEHGELPEDGGHEQWLAMVQSDIYGQIMEWLVLRILWLK